MNHCRTRAWRRHQRVRFRTKHNRLRIDLGQAGRTHYSDVLALSEVFSGHQHLALSKPEKQWKFLYLRSEKLRRAKQLKCLYPKGVWDRDINDEVTFLLSSH